jgi:hypothetical protein
MLFISTSLTEFAIAAALRHLTSLSASLSDENTLEEVEDTTIPMDVICVLDKSGSMGMGGKLTNLLHAGIVHCSCCHW